MFMELIRERRSIRRFTPQPVEDTIRDQLIEAALRAPSSRGLNPWHFIVVETPELLDKLSRSKPHGASFLKNAPLGIVVCAEADASDVWVEDTSIASIFIQLAAHSLGLGSCWIQIRKRSHDQTVSADAYIKKVLEIPDHFMIESIMAIGYPDGIKQGHPKETLQFDKVSFK